ncbi:MAG: Omp28-related outer membrane protein [Bacteroidia bacterium]
MKKIYLLLLVTAFGFEAMAQTFVSTSAEKKNAVLEEFTGIRCTFCPDGHKRAQELKDANPKDVVLINIHQGGYATKQTESEPDFTTKWGDDIAGQSDLSGYPAGTVNRHEFSASQNGGTAQSRGDWTNSANEIMAENSPVNVAIEVELDIEERELTIVAEVYYTADAANATNKLNIAILQNNVQGPQTGATSYYPEMILPNGNYNHQHMLRDLVTGQWGEDITETSMGSFFTKTYTYSIPEDINDVDVDLINLEVAAFVAEGQQEILTGVSQIVLVPEEFRADLATSEASVMENGICATSISPKLNITNEGDNTIESFDVVATINGTEYEKSFSGSIASGEGTTIEWDELSLPGGSFSLEFSSPKNINDGKLVDQNNTNSMAIAVTGHSFKADAVGNGYEAKFDGSMPDNLAFDKSQNDKFDMYYTTTYPYGAKASYGSIRYYLHSSWNIAGKPADVLFGKSDLSTTTDPYVSYWYAYSDGGQGGTAPTITIEVSDDCGTTWNTVHTENCRETGSPSDPTRLYQPGYDEYRRMYASLSDYSDKEVIVKISMTPGTSGNSLWIDEIMMISDATSLDEPKGFSSFTVYPNPVQNQANISFDLTEARNIEIKVYDAIGRVVKTVNNIEYASGAHNVNIATSDLENGIYILRAESNGDLLTTETIIKE